jgi:hypothetical protein
MIFSISCSKKRPAALVLQGGDDSSMSSTLTADRPPQQKLSLVTAIKTKGQEGCDEDTCSTTVDETYDSDDDRSISTALTSSSDNKKSVRFNLNENQEFANQQMCKEECSELWYSATDYKQFKAITLALAREVTQMETRNRAVFSYERVLNRAYDVCKSVQVSSAASVVSPLSADDRKHMRRWAQAAPSRLGLEKWAVRALCRDRAVRRNELYDVVLDLQDSLSGDDALDECLRRQSERLSLPSRLFARCMADAHAAASLGDSTAAVEC